MTDPPHETTVMSTSMSKQSHDVLYTERDECSEVRRFMRAAEEASA